MIAVLIFAGTDTQGLNSSLNSGKTWQPAGGPLSSVGAGSLAVTGLAVNPDDQHVIDAAATFTMATPQGRHSSQSVFISVDDGWWWFAMTPAPTLRPDYHTADPARVASYSPSCSWSLSVARWPAWR